MAKFFVKRNDTVVAEDSADKVIEFFATFRKELAESLGIESNDKGEFAKESIVIDPIKKKQIKADVALMLSAFSADVSGIARGREAIANLDDLQIVYLQVKSVHAGMKPSLLYRWVSSTYNKKYASSPEFEISPQYVAKYAKDRQWDSLPVPATETAQS